MCTGKLLRGHPDRLSSVGLVMMTSILCLYCGIARFESGIGGRERL